MTNKPLQQFVQCDVKHLTPFGYYPCNYNNYEVAITYVRNSYACSYTCMKTIKFVTIWPTMNYHQQTTLNAK